MVDRSNDALTNYHDNLWILLVIKMYMYQWLCRRHCWSRGVGQWKRACVTHIKPQLPCSASSNEATNHNPQKGSNPRHCSVALTKAASGVTPLWLGTDFCLSGLLVIFHQKSHSEPPLPNLHSHKDSSTTWHCETHTQGMIGKPVSRRSADTTIAQCTPESLQVSVLLHQI